MQRPADFSNRHVMLSTSEWSREISRQFEQFANGVIAIRFQGGDSGTDIPLKLLIDAGMDSADIVNLISEMLLGEYFSDRFAPPARCLFANVPEKITVDEGYRVQEIGDTALSDELMPGRRVFAVAGQQNAEVSTQIGGQQFEMTVENGFAKQCANAMSRSGAV